MKRTELNWEGEILPSKQVAALGLLTSQGHTYAGPP